ncbi:oncostatin-M-specific receptor subunit beta-like [Rhinoderma darwinii]|uniref:oncostatin-M-specific receptor subunit beta-like n=1 Tax=Rhinoderma darwinii TaxID=43563 RepID=UPI003F66FE25
MDHCVGHHVVIVTLFLTLKLGLWHCQEPEASISPVNLEIHSDPMNQRLLVDWNISKTPDESDIDIMFHIQVARSEKRNIIVNEYFKHNLSRSRMTFNWTWDSQLPLECDSHSVRIRSIVLGNVPTAEINWSEWSPWKTHYGQNRERNHAVIYPHERVVLEGSNITFCCLPGRAQTVQQMIYGSTKMMRSLDMGTDSFVISVKNVAKTKSDGSNVRCVVDKNENQVTTGTVLIVSRLPYEPKHFSCKTQDMRLLRCSWNPGAVYNFYGILKVNYVLQDWVSLKSNSCRRDYCDWPIQMNQQVYNFTLTAKNVLGERSINSMVYLNQRVLLLAPYTLRASDVNATHIALTWSLKADYTSLQIHCQVDLQEDLVTMTSRGKDPTEIYRVSLSGLQPNTQYELKVRCMAEPSLAGWSNWSNLIVRTHEDVPTGALDVWRDIEDDDDDDRIVTLYCRPSPLFRANGEISHYNIKYWPLEGAPAEREISVFDVNNASISIGRRAYSVSITAHNNAGGSPPAEIRIPANAANDKEQVTTERTYSKDGGIYITWRQNHNAHGYVVEWCGSPRSLHCDLQWKKYNSTVQSDIIKSLFKPGVRYDFRIYGSMKDGAHLLGKMAGYSVELASSVKPNVKITNIEPRSIFLDWSPYPTDGSQEGFVTGYNVYVNDTERGCTLDKSDEHIKLGDLHVCRFYIGDPNKMKIIIKGLQPNGKYVVAVVAITDGGETAAVFIKAHTPSDAGAALLSIIVPIITVSVLALMILFIGCWKRAWFKRICLPDIPDPNKSKIFSFNGTKQGDLNRNILPTINREAQKVDFVSIQENRQHKTHEINESPEHQLHEIYTKIQTTGESQRDKEFSESYLPCSNEKPSYPPPINDPLYKTQPLTYLEFFNQTYTSTPDDIGDSAQGYRPQTNIVQVHCPQSVYPESELDEDIVVGFNSPGYGSEAMSPTSVDSTAFELID